MSAPSRFLVWSTLVLLLCRPGFGQATPTAVPAHKTSTFRGKAMYLYVCAMCHGKDAKGYPQLGKDLTTSLYVRTHTDDELVNFIRHGRKHTAGFVMPAKGGSPELTDSDLYDIVAWLRTASR